MDPDACMRDIQDLLEQDQEAIDGDAEDIDREHLAALLESLAAWIRKGGFLPLPIT